MKTYTDLSTTHMRFHIFMRFFGIPIPFFLCFISVTDILMVGGLSKLDNIGLVGFVYNIAYGIFMAVAFAAAFRYSKVYLWSLAAAFVAEISHSIYVLIFLIKQGPPKPLEIIGPDGAMIYIEVQSSVPGQIYMLAATIIMAILVFIYYYKRRKLFDGKYKKPLYDTHYEQAYREYEQAEAEYLEDEREAAANSEFMLNQVHLHNAEVDLQEEYEKGKD